VETLIRERYEPLERLGVGGEARVVKALDRQHDRFVALKIRTVRDDHEREQLLNEARVLLAIPPHPALPLVREDFFDGDEYVIAMDWVDGTDLETLLRERGRPGLAPSSVLSYLAQAAEALTHLHSQNPSVIHGDLKPGNLILTTGGRVKLVDFGLSSTPYGLHRRSGTPGFRAPELATDGVPSRASDIYALAATAFALLTGSPPAGVLPPWEGIPPVQAQQLEAAIRLGVRTDPSRRPATPGELIERLRAGWGQALPTGVLTFCLSDIEGSTAIWDSEPAAMAEALVRHDELIADCVESHGGRFLKSVREGDATVSVFDTASHALEAALAASCALAHEPWPGALGISVRFGLHTGEAQRRDVDYYGPTLNLAARLREQADGGQVFLSSVTAELVEHDLPAGVELVDLGPHRLDGIALPQTIKAVKADWLSTPLPAGACPYRGLLAFEVEDADFFFGREGVVNELIGRLGPRRLLAVVGASGSGKSSVLRAGLVAAVRSGRVSGIDRAVLLTPAADPRLEVADSPRVLVVVDQFEELFTLCDDPDRRVAFIEALLALPAAVVIGMRADVYGRLTATAELARVVSENQVLLGSMTDTELERAVTEPARLAGLRLEPGLVELILRDVAGEPGALPLMSHALSVTWERRDGRTLTVAGYRESGGVASAIARTADAVVSSLPQEQRELTRGVFLRLTELGEGIEDARRRVAIDEMAPEGTPPATVRALLDRLADARLVTLSNGTAEVAHEVLIREWPTLRGWLEEDRAGIRLQRQLDNASRLWDAGGREDSDLYRGTRLGAAVDWVQTHHAALNATERAFLDASVDSATRAQNAQLRANRRLRRLVGGIALLLVAAIGLVVFALISRGQTVSAQTAARAQALAAESENQQSVNPERAVLLAIEAARTKATAETMFALRGAIDRSTIRYRLAQAPPQNCGGPSIGYDPGRGPRTLVEALCSGALRFLDATTGRLERTVRLQSAPVQTTLAFTGGGSSLLAAAGSRVMALDPATGAVRKTSPSVPGLVTFAVAPHAPLVAILATGELDFWNVSTGRLTVTRPHQLLSYEQADTAGERPRQANRFAFSPDGRRLAFSFYTPTVALVVYDIRRHAIVAASPEPASAAAVAFSPDGQRLALGYLGAIVLLDARTLAVERRFSPDSGNAPTALAFSPDGSELAYGFVDGTAGLAAADTGRSIATYHGGTSPVWQTSFSADGRLVATGSLDGTVAAWRAAGLAPKVVYSGGWLESNPDGLVALYPARPGHGITVQRLLADGRPAGRPLVVSSAPDPSSPVDQPGFSPGGRFVVVLPPARGGQETMRVWDVMQRRLVRSVQIQEAVADTAFPAISPDGNVVARGVTVSLSRFDLRLLDLRSGRSRVLASTACVNGWQGITFSRSGRLLFAGTGCGSAWVWNVATGRLEGGRIALGTHQENGAAFSPDDHHVAVTSGDGAIVVSPVPVTGQAITLTQNTQGVGGDAYSPDGRYLASAGLDRTVRIFDAHTLAELRVIPQPEPVYVVAFTPDSKSVLSSTGDSTWLWDACTDCENPTALLALARSHVTRTLTAEERRTFEPH
jgi:class 3 adenylate cyclase/WD40 repeat protein/tRNA A-37 threonylcarbamoyl transferase component Bud32